MRAKKSLGQHFLMHARIAERIANTAGITADTCVFEIGPGTGVLTRELLKKSNHVIALEADAELFAELQKDFAQDIETKHLTLIKGDIRKFDLNTLPKKYMIVANIPYYLTGEILRQCLEANNQPSCMTLLVQKEVAARIAREKKESLLSLSIKAYGIPTYEFTVPKGAFRPAPKVDSAVLSVRNISREGFSSQAQEKRFFELLHAGFAHKRKFLRNNLAEKGFPGEGIPPKARAEDILLPVWLALSEY
jgi:16S rRNA (adenine1518-N6/adenine1519-N6)-dimethyltransferase